MINKIILLFVVSFNLYANSFDGCGEYRFHGVLIEDKEAKYGFSYIVKAQTLSQMKFEFADPKEVAVLLPFLKQETTLEAKIKKEMDGTKGLFSDLKKIERRFPNPLDVKNTGITKLQEVKCQK